MQQNATAKLQTLKFTAAIAAMSLAASLLSANVSQAAPAAPAASATAAAKTGAATPAQTPAADNAMPSTNGPGADLESAITQAQLQRKAGDFQGAAKTLSQILLFSSDDGRVLAEYGKTLIALGRVDDALAFLERAIQVDPTDWSLYSAQGVAYDQKGNYQAARMAYSQALALKPNDPTVLNNAAMSFVQSGDLDSAEKLLQQATPGSADNPRIAQNISLVQNLKAARPAKPVAAAPAPAAAPVAPTAVPAPSVTAPAPVAAVQAPSAPEVHAPAPAAPSPAQASAQSAPAPAQAIAGTQAAPKPAPAQPTASVAQTAPAPAAPKVAPKVAMEPSPAPEKPKVEAAPKPVAPPPPAQTATAEKPAPAATGSLAALQADPTVRMAPVPKDDLAGAVKPAPAKPQVAKTETVASLPPREIAPNFVNAPPPAKPATQPAVQRTAASSGKTSYYVQAGSFGTPERADRMAHTLDSLGARVQQGNVDGHAVYRVRIGPFLDIQQANAAVAHAQEMGHADLKIISE